MTATSLKDCLSKAVYLWDCARQATMRGARQPHVATSRPIQMLDCLTQTAPKANLCEKISNSEAARPESRVWRQKNDTIPINERI